MGSNIQDLIAPDSRKTLKRLFRDRLTDTSGQKPSEVEDSPSGSRGEDKGSNSNGSSNANVVSMQSFPMLEVNMDATQQPSAAGDDVSESSADNNRKRKNTNNDATSSLTRQNSSFGTYFSSNENANPYAIKQVKIQKTDSGNATSSKSSGGAEDKIHHHKELVKSKAAVLADRSLSSTTCNSESQKKRSEDEAEDFGYREPESPDGSTNTERGENRGEFRLCVDVMVAWKSLLSYERCFFHIYREVQADTRIQGQICPKRSHYYLVRVDLLILHQGTIG